MIAVGIDGIEIWTGKLNFDLPGTFAPSTATTPRSTRWCGPNQESFDIKTTTQDVRTGDHSLELGLGTVDTQRRSGSISVAVEGEIEANLGSTSLTDDDSDTVVTL